MRDEVIVAPAGRMPGGNRLGFGEFLEDIRGVLASPARRFELIRERGALWGSLLLLVAPAYFGLHFVGAIYFDRDPFPGYAFIIPLVTAVALSMLKFLLFHVFGRSLEGGGSYRRGSGTYRDLLTVAGYTNIPNIAAFALAISLFLFFPAQVGALLRDFRALTLSVLIAAGVALFVWALILIVLAMRVVYRMRDAKIVVAFLLGSAASAGIAFAAVRVIHPMKVELPYIRPILSERFRQFLAPDPLSPSSRVPSVAIHIDRIAYRFKTPQRFDVVAYRGSSGLILGRIVALSGETVELRRGELVIDGRVWSEPYIAPEFEAPASLPAALIPPGHYFVLPEDRRLVDSLRSEVVVAADRILGRRAIKRWPLGWLEFRPTAFLKGQPK
jgi:signal peptidase I